MDREFEHTPENLDAKREESGIRGRRWELAMEMYKAIS